MIDSREGAATTYPEGETVDLCELSVVMPCLNEAETLATCIRKVQQCIEERGLRAEIIIADNGSTDGSLEIAEQHAVRVVHAKPQGYGCAIRTGIAAARGRYVLIGDGDDSYDFSQIPVFLEKLRQGDDLVMGNRFRGGIAPGAMPWKHRWIGNPVLSGIGRLLFGCPVGDFHCGLRALRRSAYERMQLNSTGMEFASEIVIRASLCRLKISEVPIRLSPDGRTRRSHLRPWRDGFRHVWLMLLLRATAKNESAGTSA